jgi:hypothetical protein
MTRPLVNTSLLFCAAIPWLNSDVLEAAELCLAWTGEAPVPTNEAERWRVYEWWD